MAKGLTGYRKHLPYYSPKATWKDIQQLLENSRDQFEDAYENVLTTFKEYAQYEMSHSVCRLARILSADYIRAEALFRSLNSNIHFTHMYALTPNEPGKLRVFTNFEIAPGHNGDALTGACPYQNSDVVEPLLKRISTDMANPAAAKGWTPIARGRGRLKRYEDMTIERALMRYSSAKNSHNEKDIKNVAALFEELRMPLEVHFAETPEQVLYMYSSGPSSCMSAVGKERAWGFMVNAGRHPCDFFAYHPYIRGCYTKTKAKGAVTARTFLYTRTDNKEYYGRIYGSDGRAATALKNALEERGIRSLPDEHGACRDGYSGYFMRECSFKIPGIAHGGTYVVPFPYLDNLRGGVNFTYDKDTHEFTANCYDGSNYTTVDGKKVRYTEFNGYTGMTSGFISESSMGIYLCHQCGAGIIRGNTMINIIERENGNRYCSQRCVDNAGKCIATVGDASKVIMNKNDAYYDPVANQYFTTEVACLERGGMLFEEDTCTRSETTEYTIGGHTTSSGYRTVNATHAIIADQMYKANSMSHIWEQGVKIELKKYMEIDWEKHQGVRIIGAIPEDFHADIDNRYGYPISGETHRGKKIQYAESGETPFVNNKLRGAVNLSAHSRLIEDEELAA